MTTAHRADLALQTIAKAFKHITNLPLMAATVVESDNGIGEARFIMWGGTRTDALTAAAAFLRMAAKPAGDCPCPTCDQAIQAAGTALQALIDAGLIGVTKPNVH